MVGRDQYCLYFKDEYWNNMNNKINPCMVLYDWKPSLMCTFFTHVKKVPHQLFFFTIHQFTRLQKVHSCSWNLRNSFRYIFLNFTQSYTKSFQFNSDTYIFRYIKLKYKTTKLIACILYFCFAQKEHPFGLLKGHTEFIYLNIIGKYNK